MRTIKTEEFIVKAGVAIPLSNERMTQAGMYMEPTGVEVVTLPPKLTLKPRRLALYPVNSIRPFPLSGTAVLPPEAMKPEDFLNLYGPYPPTLLRRAAQGLVAEFEKFRLKDWIVIAAATLGALGAWGAFIYAYKIWKLVGN